MFIKLYPKVKIKLDFQCVNSVEAIIIEATPGRNDILRY
jgi:hypothetical protein